MEQQLYKPTTKLSKDEKIGRLKKKPTCTCFASQHIGLKQFHSKLSPMQALWL